MARGAISTHYNKYYENSKDFCIYTPIDISNWIFDILSFRTWNNIIDVCCGSGNLSKPFSKTKTNIIGIDTKKTIDSTPINNQNSFINTAKNSISKDFTIGEFLNIDFLLNKSKDKYLKNKNIELVLTNPPWNDCPGKKLYPFEILLRIIDVFGINIPIILFTPMGLLLNRRYGANRGLTLENLFNNGLNLTSIASMPIDAFYPGSKTKGQQWQILFFNLPELKTHYWYTKKTREKYLTS